MREGIATGGGVRGREWGCQVEDAAPGKVKPGMLYNGLKGEPMGFNKMIEF